MAVARCEQVWQKGLGAVDDAPEVDLHHPLEILERHDLYVAHESDACVVVDLIHRAEMLFDRVGVCKKRLTLGDVESVGLHWCADGRQTLLGARQTFGVDVTDRQFCAAACQFDRQRLPDARPGTGDDGDFSRESACELSIASSVAVNQCALGTIRDRTVENNRW